MTLDNMPFAVALTNLRFANCTIYSSLIWDWKEFKFICSVLSMTLLSLLSLKYAQKISLWKNMFNLSQNTISQSS